MEYNSWIKVSTNNLIGSNYIEDIFMKTLFYFVMLFLIGFSAFSAEIDLDMKRVCLVDAFDHGPYHNGPVPSGYFARTSDSGELSLNDMIQDKFIYFTERPDGPTDWPVQYVWRYSGPAQLISSNSEYSLYIGGSIIGAIEIKFKLEEDSVKVIYFGSHDNVFLFSLTCNN